MYNYRYAAMILTGTMILGGLSGCASDDGSSGVNNASTDTAKEQNTHTQTTNLENTIEFTESTFSEKEFMARVEAIDEGTLTLSLLSGGMGAAPGGEEGTAPGGEEGATPGGEEGTAPGGEMGTAPGREEGNAPGGEEGNAPGGEEGTAPGGEMGAAPGGDMGTAPGGEEGNAPGGDMGTAPGGDMGATTSEATLVLKDPTILQDAQGNTVDLSAVTEGTLLQITLDEDGRIVSIIVSQGMEAINGAGGVPSGSMGQGMPGGASGVESYTTVNEYTTDTTVSKENLTSTGTDENVVLVSDGATVNLEEVTVKRTSSDSTGGDNSSFYGVGAAILVTDGTVNVTDSNIMTDAAGGAGVFAYGDGIAYVTDTTITTNQNTSGGIHVAGGGTLYAKNCTVETNGASAAAIRSDRGGGTMVVEGGSYTSNGTGSPAVYVTANISVSDAALEATNSEAICIEGFNSLTLTDVDLTGNMPDQETNDCTWNVILYQSMSGDSEVGNSTFSMTGGSLTAKNGGMFYTTNTESTFYISGVDITYAKENDFFLKCTGNANQRGWGSTGANGANCTFTANAQEMVGDIYWDSISTLDFFMEKNSTLTGAILQDETNAGNGGNGYCNVTLDSTSTWIVTADSVVTSLVNQGTIVDANGKSVSIVGMDGKSYVKGDSTLTITVENYSES